MEESSIDLHSKSLLIEELYDIFTKCKEKCSDCDKYMIQLYEHFKLTHVSENTHSQSDSDCESTTDETSMIKIDLDSWTPASPVHLSHVSLIEHNITQDPEIKEHNEDPLETRNVICGEDSFEYNTLKGLENEAINSGAAGSSIPILLALEEKPVPASQSHRPGSRQLSRRLSVPRSQTLNTGKKLELYPESIHCGVERYCICWCCGLGFASRSEHERHFLSAHKGDLPYKCETCDKSFGKFWLLSRHKMVHLAEKPFKCKFCGKGFADTSNLLRHKKRYHE